MAQVKSRGTVYCACGQSARDLHHLYEHIVYMKQTRGEDLDVHHEAMRLRPPA